MIRKAKTSDIAATHEIASLAYAPYTPLIGRPAAPALADHQAHLEREELWVYEEAGKVLGYLSAFPDGTALALDAGGVTPEAQGKGIGRALIAHCEALAARRGLDAVVLYTNVHMTSNLRLYPSLGYVETGRDNVDGYDRVFFRKSVN